MVLASIIFHYLDEDMKTRLRTRAAKLHRSMEEGARLVLREAVERKKFPWNLASAVHTQIAPLSGMDLKLSPRESQHH